MKFFRRGMTLIELLVACGLAVVLGSVAFNFIAHSVETHRRSQLGRLAQGGVRDLGGILVAELRSASPPPYAGFVASPVFWPGIWGATLEGVTLNNFYPREELVDPDDSDLKVDRVSNRLLYVRRDEKASSSLTGDPLAGYRLVEIFVPKDHPNVVERRQHDIYPTAASALQEMSIEGADNNAHAAWVIDVAKVGAEPPVLSDDKKDIVFDAGEGARVAFRVSHKTLVPVGDPGRVLNPEFFDPAVFLIEVTVAYNDLKPEDPMEVYPKQERWQVLRAESTELRIPAARAE